MADKLNLIDLKERIAISDAFTPAERDLLLRAINATPEWQEVSRSFGTLMADMRKMTDTK